MKIVIIDDDYFVVESLIVILQNRPEISVVATGQDGNQALALYNEYQPDILLLDIRMQQMSGIEAAKQVMEQYPEAKILFLTTFLDDDYIMEALKMKAKGYLIKQDYPSLIPALYAVAAGQCVYGADIISRLPQAMPKEAASLKEEFAFTEKEKEVLALVAEGYSNKEIASLLFIGEGTVRNTVTLLLDKVNLKSRTQLAIFYLKKQYTET